MNKGAVHFLKKYQNLVLLSHEYQHFAHSPAGPTWLLNMPHLPRPPPQPAQLWRAPALHRKDESILPGPWQQQKSHLPIGELSDPKMNLSATHLYESH